MPYHCFAVERVSVRHAIDKSREWPPRPKLIPLKATLCILIRSLRSRLAAKLMNARIESPSALGECYLSVDYELWRLITIIRE